MVHIMLFAMLSLLYFYNSTSRSMCAMPNMAVFSYYCCYYYYIYYYHHHHLLYAGYLYLYS